MQKYQTLKRRSFQRTAKRQINRNMDKKTSVLISIMKKLLQEMTGKQINGKYVMQSERYLC